jgi:uncharacterized protein (DUF58 family)
VAKLALFRFVFNASRRLRERLTAGGLVVAGLTGFAAAFGLDTQSNLAHALFALGACLLAVDLAAVALAKRRAPRFAARRRLPEFVTAGEPARYRIELRNAGARASPPLALAERLSQPWPSPAALRHHRAPAANRFDRRVGYPAFLDMLRRLRALEAPAIACPPLLPGQGAELEVAALPTARGVAVFEELCLILTGPLGLAAARVPVAAPPASLPVLPARRAVDVPSVASHRQYQPGGIALAQHVGDAEEFRALRDYRPGDPLRSIHWRSFARLGRPVVREFQEEFFSRHALVLDTAAAHRFAPEFEAAVSMAAWLVARPRDADSLLDLMFVGERVHRLTAGRGLGGADGLMRVLATVAPTPPESITPLLTTLEHHAAQLSSVIAIFLAWDEPRRQAIRRLMARGVQPTVIVVDAADAAAAPDDAGFAGLLRHVAAVPAGAAGSA